jgi:insulin gene enhancer protein ISL-1
MGYSSMHGIPMVATSPVRHESPVGMNPVEIHSYEPPWKALTDFALHTDLDRLHGPPPPPQFQHLVNQVLHQNQFFSFSCR